MLLLKETIQTAGVVDSFDTYNLTILGINFGLPL